MKKHEDEKLALLCNVTKSSSNDSNSAVQLTGRMFASVNSLLFRWDLAFLQVTLMTLGYIQIIWCVINNSAKCYHL